MDQRRIRQHKQTANYMNRKSYIVWGCVVAMHKPTLRSTYKSTTNYIHPQRDNHWSKGNCGKRNKPQTLWTPSLHCFGMLHAHAQAKAEKHTHRSTQHTHTHTHTWTHTHTYLHNDTHRCTQTYDAHNAHMQHTVTHALTHSHLHTQSHIKLHMHTHMKHIQIHNNLQSHTQIHAYTHTEGNNHGSMGILKTINKTADSLNLNADIVCACLVAMHKPYLKTTCKFISIYIHPPRNNH